MGDLDLVTHPSTNRTEHSLRSWRDSAAGERAAEPPYSLAKPAREFTSDEAASDFPACHISYGFCLPSTFITFDFSIR